MFLIFYIYFYASNRAIIHFIFRQTHLNEFSQNPIALGVLLGGVPSQLTEALAGASINICFRQTGQIQTTRAKSPVIICLSHVSLLAAENSTLGLSTGFYTTIRY